MTERTHGKPNEQEPPIDGGEAGRFERAFATSQADVGGSNVWQDGIRYIQLIESSASPKRINRAKRKLEESWQTWSESPSAQVRRGLDEFLNTIEESQASK
jgi:hypothetical protein